MNPFAFMLRLLLCLALVANGVGSVRAASVAPAVEQTAGFTLEHGGCHDEAAPMAAEADAPSVPPFEDGADGCCESGSCLCACAGAGASPVLLAARAAMTPLDGRSTPTVLGHGIGHAPPELASPIRPPIG